MSARSDSDFWVAFDRCVRDFETLVARAECDLDALSFERFGEYLYSGHHGVERGQALLTVYDQ